MKKTFVMRGQTVSGGQEVLEFGGKQKETKGMAYRMTEFSLFPSTNIISQAFELCGSVTAGKTAVAPTDPNFDNDGLIATNLTCTSTSQPAIAEYEIVNDTFLITQNLILMVQNTHGEPINWQCRFEAVKMTDAQTAATNFKQYTIFDE
jgi:hypothetical protein